MAETRTGARRPASRRPPAPHRPRPPQLPRRRRRRATDPKRRLVGLLIAVCVGFAVIAGRLVMIQAVSPDRYAAVGVSQRLRDVVLPAGRGAIFDRNGRELAMSIAQSTVWANPHLVTDPFGAARVLAPVLGEEEETLRDRLSRDAAFVYLARKVDDATAAEVEALGIEGVFFVDEPKRFNPAGDLGRPLIGVVGLDNNGLAGLELQYEKALRGTPGELRVERDPYGHDIPAGERSVTPARPGDDLVLTIDRSLQYELEKSLAAEIVASSAKGGTAIVMNPRTGEILAMASFAAKGDGTPPTPSVNNTAVTDVYEPGSVNKVITIAAALEEGLVAPGTTLAVPDHLRLGDHTFTDHDPHPVKQWTVTDILANSSNIGTIKIGQQLGKHRIDRYLRKFGLGSKTGLQFPGEPRGLLLEPKRWSGTSIGTVPIGYGLAATALQMLLAYNTVANDGLWVAPKVVRAVVGSDGEQQPTPASTSRRVVSARTAQQVTGMLTQVVEEGTGTAAAIDGYTVAGKTGTARKPFEGGYKKGAYVASFAGFVPAEDPQLSAIVVLDEPYPIYGGIVSAPVFAEINQYALRLFKIPPPARPAPSAGVVLTDPEAARADAEFDGATRPSPTVTAPPARRTAPTTTTP